MILIFLRITDVNLAFLLSWSVQYRCNVSVLERSSRFLMVFRFALFCERLGTMFSHVCLFYRYRGDTDGKRWWRRAQCTLCCFRLFNRMGLDMSFVSTLSMKVMSFFMYDGLKNHHPLMMFKKPQFCHLIWKCPIIRHTRPILTHNLGALCQNSVCISNISSFSPCYPNGVPKLPAWVRNS